MINPKNPIQANLEAIKKVLEKTTPEKWSFTYDGSSDWTVGEYPDPQAKPICGVYSKDDDWARNHCQWIAASKEVANYLIDKLEKATAENDLLKTQIACATDLANTWSRERNVTECTEPYFGLFLRDLISRLWDKEAQKRLDGGK